jgi:hypothetical protein
MSTEQSQESSQNEGPATLRDALLESFDENTGDTDDTIEAKAEVEPEDTELEASESVEAEPESSEDESTEESQDEAEVILAPEHWSDEDKAVFTELPSTAQDYLLKREKQYEQGIQKKAEEIKPIMEAFKPYEAMLSLRGIDKSAAIRTWAQAQAVLDQDPALGIEMLIQSYGDQVKQQLLTKLGIPSESNGLDQEYFNPEVQKLQDEINQLKRQNQQSAMTFQTQQQQAAIDEINDFRSQQNEDGSAKYPHFDQVGNMMRALLTSGAASDLPSAYEQAVWSVPEFRDEHLAKQKAETEKAEAQKREKAAKKAKTVAKSVSGKGTKPAEKPKKATLRDDIGDAWDQSVKGEL